MLEKLLDLLKLILEKYLIPALISVFITILSVNFFTKDFKFLKALSKTENYVLQGLFFFLIVLIVYAVICKIVTKNKSNHKWNEFEKGFNEDLINEIDTYPNDIREFIKQLFYSKNSPMKITIDYNDAQHLQIVLKEKVIFSMQKESNGRVVYLCRLTDVFYNRLKRLSKDKGCITHF